MLDLNCDTTPCLISTKDEKELWHRKLRHGSMKQISMLYVKDLVHGLPKIKYEKFELFNACSLDEQVKSSFKSINTTTTNQALQLLPMDLFGPKKGAVVGFCRNHLSRAVAGFAERVLASSPLEIETLAIQFALVYLAEKAKFGRELHLHISLTTYSLSVYKLIMGSDPCPWILRPMVDDCKERLGQLSNVLLVHE